MQILFILTLIIAILQNVFQVEGRNIVCFFDSSNPTQMVREDVEHALNYCTHFIYGYATLTPRFFTLSIDGSLERSLKLTDVAELKKKYPSVKFLLSLGGDRDMYDPSKYLDILEATAEKHEDFLKFALQLLRLYKFDGLDLAYQFPRHQEGEKTQLRLFRFWKGVKSVFKKRKPKKIVEYKDLFRSFVTYVHKMLQKEHLLLTLSVLPHVNATLYLDLPDIQDVFDLIHLWLFDFHDPLQNPNEADYPAPLMAPPNRDNRRLASNNVDFQVQYWLSHHISSEKLILAIPSYGRTWKMSFRSQHNGFPIVDHTKGPAEPGEDSQTSGLLSWPEICSQLKNRSLSGHGSYDYGLYIVYPGNEYFAHDTWIGYDGPNIAHYKSLYAKQQNLGGVALVDLSLDDYRGSCNGIAYPILKYMKGLVE